MPFTTNHAVVIKSMLLEALCAPEKSTVLREGQLPDAINSVFSNLCAYLKKNIDERYFSKLDGVSLAERIVVCAEDKSAALTKAASTKSKTMGLKVGADEADNEESYDSDSTE